MCRGAEKINDYTKAQNWKVSKVEVNGTVFEDYKDYKEIKVAQDSTIKVYYTPKHNDNFQGSTSFYDYTVKAGYKDGKYYSFNMLGEDVKYVDNVKQKITSGTQDQNYDSYKYNFTVDSGYKADGSKFTATKATVNGYDSNVKWTEGLLKGVEEDGTVKFNYPEPGFFVDKDETVPGTETYLRKVIKDYKLVFDQNGDSYRLTKVIDQKGNQLATAGRDFFPLDGVSRNEESENHNNYFFGMRYDVTFKIGDYVGPLNYKFTGDDDLWVVLDGNKIVIDLGGIHQAAEKKVDLWDYVGHNDENEHTLTILYMERGAGASNCQMEFTLPSARISEVTNVPTTDLVLKKVNKSQDALGGALFKLVNNSDTNESQTATSVDGTGRVEFTRLRPGTYTLTEAMAPNGYEASQESWIVEVTSSDDKKAVATLYKADGKTKIEKDADSSYHIMNYTQQEIIESSMDYSKTATINDWDKRTYDINITASSKTTSSSVVTTGGVADVVMALDVSGSMEYTQTAGTKKTKYSEVGKYNKIRNSLKPNKIYYYYYQDYNVRPMINIDNTWMYYYRNSWWDIKDSDTTYIYEWPSRITALKEVVNQFIRNTATSSPKSNIGLAPFNTAVTNATETLLNVDKNKDTLIKNVSRLSVTGGTSPHTALNEALKLLNNAKNPKYVILFTDGEPTGNGRVWDDNYQDYAEKAAKALKDKGIKVFTVGFALSESGQKFLAGDENNSTNYPGIASKGCAFNATNAEDLAKIFEKIQHTVTEDTAIQNATVTDVIDPRFVILDEEGNAITADQLKDGKTVKVNDGTVYLDAKGNQCIKWEGQRIPNKKENEAGNACWSKSIKVKAKDDYIGGNNVPTNVSPDSKISTGYGDAILPQQKVNVKSDLVVNNNETTIFYGDKVPTKDEILKRLFDKTQPQGNVTQLDGTKKLVTYTMGADGKQFNENDFTLTWYEDEACTTEIKVENMAEVVPEPDSKQYYLKVTYNVGRNANTTKKNKNGEDVTYISGKSNGSGVLTAHNSQDDKTREYGVYTIHIITGQIQIIKKLENAAKEDVEFTFDVTNEAGAKIATATATIGAGNKEGTVTLKLEKGVKGEISKDDKSILTRLARGEYTVTENVNPNYTLKNLVAGDATNCKNAVELANKQIKFSIGTYTNDAAKDIEVLKNGDTETTKGRSGVAVFTNEKSVADVKLVKVDAADKRVTIRDAKFALYEADKNWSKASNTPVKENIVSGDNGRIDLNAIPVGNYLLEETKAATGYSLPTNPWRITVGGGGIVTVTVMDGNGHAVDVGNVSENGTTIYQITNTKVYSLPQSGGPGTYGFTISGVAILATALLLFINNKRREEEAKRS